MGQEPAPGPGSRESPGGGGDNGAHSRGLGASAPAASQGAPAPARLRSGSAAAASPGLARLRLTSEGRLGRGPNATREPKGRGRAPPDALYGPQLACGAPAWHFSVWGGRRHLASAGPLLATQERTKPCRKRGALSRRKQAFLSGSPQPPVPLRLPNFPFRLYPH